jgi:hypothetical protein
VNLKPVTANPKLKWEASYTLLDVRQQFYGFSSTAGDPFAIEWGPSTQAARHLVGVRWSDFPIYDLVYVTMVVQALSGQRFTPMISGDVNGDGANNDRAFLVDPATAKEPAMADAMRTLLANGAPAARDCLARQRNQLASRGSCHRWCPRWRRPATTRVRSRRASGSRGSLVRA